jgi:hypothetical protein
MADTTITIPCLDTLLPKPADLANIFKQLANLPAQLELQGLEAEADAIRKKLEDIKDLLGNFPVTISDPVFGSLEIPEIEWEKRINAILSEYHTFILAKFLELINEVLPLSFEIPIPPFDIKIDIVKLFSDPEYKGTIKKQFTDEVEKFYPLLPKMYRTFDGLYGVESIDMKIEAVWEYVISQLQKGALAILHETFGALIDKFKSIWDPLGLPALPDLTDLDVEALIKNLIESIEDQIAAAPQDAKDALRKEAIKKLESIQIAGFSLMDLLGGEPTDFVESMEGKMERFKKRLRNFGEEWPKYLLQLWMDEVAAFFKAIGLTALVEWITFTFCDFLKLIGVPSTIVIPIKFDLLPIPAILEV